MEDNQIIRLYFQRNESAIAETADHFIENAENYTFQKLRSCYW